MAGPYYLKSYYNDVTKSIIENRQNNNKFLFENIDDALTALREDFCSIEELKGIFELETINDVHSENVSDHTLKVINNLSKNDFYKRFRRKRKAIG